MTQRPCSVRHVGLPDRLIRTEWSVVTGGILAYSGWLVKGVLQKIHKQIATNIYELS